MCYKPLSKSYEVAEAKKILRATGEQRRGEEGEEEEEKEKKKKKTKKKKKEGGWMNRRKGRERDEGNLYRKELLVCMPADQVAKHSK